MTRVDIDLIRRLQICHDASIRDAMTVIDRGQLRIALVVDDQDKLVGTITDGDVRRGLLRGMDIHAPIDGVYCKTPTVCHVDDPRSVVLRKALDGRHQQIPIVNDDGVPVGIEEIHELVRPARRHNKVVIMAGGLGTRLRPLTARVPKPMLRVGNKPILERTLEKLTASGFFEFIISVNYLSHVIKEYFGDGQALGAHIEYIEEDKALGTAGALGLTHDRLDTPFLVMNGDLLTDLDFATLLDYHLSEQAVATMCVRQYDIELPFGVVNIEKHLVTGIEEKPIQKFLVNAGIYALSPEALLDIEPGAYLDMPDLFQQFIRQNRQVASFLLHEYWLDIGRQDDYARANHDIGELVDEA